MLRRPFIKVIAASINVVVVFALAIPALRYLLDPLWRRADTPSGGERETRFIRAGLLSATSGKRPVRTVVSGDRWDAFTHYPSGPIGTVWLLRKDQDDRDPQLRCLSSVCPHLGCAIDYASDRGVFQCPCHASEFGPDGRRRSGPSPRDMDELECRIAAADEHGRRWIEVRYQQFRTGVPEKVRLADYPVRIADRRVVEA